LTPLPAHALPATCPRCGRDAPIVYRGVIPYCTACGALRVPLSGPSVNLAGRPSRVGGTVAGVFGWLILLMGFSVALGIGLLFAAFHLLAVALALALPIVLVSAVVGGLLVRRGASLNRSGVEIARATREQALLALMAHRGSIHALDAARALGVGVAEADANLTDLAKRAPETVAVDIEDTGEIAYRFVDSRIRVEGEPRVDVVAGADDAAREVADDEVEEQRGATAPPRTVPRA
jgi:hypothetical protein